MAPAARSASFLSLQCRSTAYDRSCTTCPFGAVMPTEVIVDHWNPKQTTRWRVETHCYGPHDCPRYRAGRPRSVPGRKPGMVFIDES